MKITFPTLLTFLIFIVSCSQSPGAKTGETTEASPGKPAFEKLKTGIVTDKVLITADSSQSYAIYVPAGYNSSTPYPVIYAFDPHKTGKLPVGLYKDLAEKYNYIIVGSNNSENGNSWELSQSIAKALFKDVQTRLHIDSGRIYLMGFSGGARIANALTITDHTISGVICAGASNPAVTVTAQRNNYTFFGIAGNADFNYSEIQKYTMTDLAGNRIKNSFVSFDGKHEWPPAPAMDEAFLWLELNHMRRNPKPQPDSLTLQNLQQNSSGLEKLLEAGKEYEAFELCRKVINYYEQLGDLSAFFSCYQQLKSNEKINKQLKLNEADMIAEEKLKQEYIHHFETKDIDWWQKDIVAINSQIKSNKNLKASLVKKRLLGYLSLVCYMQTSGALKQNDLRAAGHFGKLYVLVDPENHEAHYLMAVIHAKNRNQDQALRSLKTALNNGYADKKRIMDESAFADLKNAGELQEVLTQIK
ncbi:MAG TPA: hypothetical protein VF868_14385 [Bacteroidia bacterium]|jgi:dienelactone hydrolase